MKYLNLVRFKKVKDIKYSIKCKILKGLEVYITVTIIH